MNGVGREALERVQSGLNHIEGLIQAQRRLRRMSTHGGVHLSEPDLHGDDIEQVVRMLNRTLTKYRGPWDMLGFDIRGRFVSDHRECFARIIDRHIEVCPVCRNRPRQCLDCSNKLLRSIQELRELAENYECPSETSSDSFRDVPLRQQARRRRHVAHLDPSDDDLLNPVQVRGARHWVHRSFDQLPRPITWHQHPWYLHPLPPHPEPEIPRPEPLALEDDLDDILDTYAGLAREAELVEDWRIASEEYRRAIDEITNRLDGTNVDQDRHSDLISRRVEYRSCQLAAMAKDRSSGQFKVKRAVDEQMKDIIDASPSHELHLNDDKFILVVQSIADALCSHGEEGLAEARLQHLSRLRHISRAIWKSEICYQLGTLYGRQNRADSLPRLRDSMERAGSNTRQLLKCSVKWAEEGERHGTNIRDITDALSRVWEKREGLLRHETMLKCGLILGKGYLDQGQLDSAESVLRETYGNLQNDDPMRITTAKYLILASNQTNYTRELEALCRTVITAPHNDAVERARYEFILGRLLNSSDNNADKLLFLRLANETMERQTTAFDPSDLNECRVRLARALKRAEEPERVERLMKDAWDARSQLSNRVQVLAGLMYARQLAQQTNKGRAAEVFNRMWTDHGATALPASRQPDADGFWRTLVAAAGYYATFLSANRATDAQVRAVVRRGIDIQRQLRLPANAALEQLNEKYGAVRRTPKRRGGLW